LVIQTFGCIYIPCIEEKKILINFFIGGNEMKIARVGKRMLKLESFIKKAVGKAYEYGNLKLLSDLKCYMGM
jgi:hypothetical protein